MSSKRDAVRPSEATFKAVYERGYQTWASLWEKAVADKHVVQDCLDNLRLAFPNHPYFPEALKLDKSVSNTVLAKGTTTWATTRESCDLPPFQEEVIFQVASSQVTPVHFLADSNSTTSFADYFGRHDDHIPILTVAWAYILSARWAELIQGACPPAYGNRESQEDAENGSTKTEDCDATIMVDEGDVDEDAARWWTAILSPDGSWNASIRSDTGTRLYAPWAIRIQSGPTFLVSSRITSHSQTTNFRPASFSTAMGYLSGYCSLHNVTYQSQAALAAALLIPVAKWDNRRIELPIPRLPRNAQTRLERREGREANSAWDGELCQLDRLLTLSCHSRGVKALLNSVFFDPDVACNVCGAWLQGSFAFLDSKEAQDPSLRLRMFMNRDPGLGFLWLGAFITGAETRCLREARGGWWKVDLSSAAWTETHVSFLQELVTKASPADERVSRADECRMTYLCHEPDQVVAPLFPFAPFGSTASEDTDLEVRRHVRCSAVHGLVYGGFTWDCNGGKRLKQEINNDLGTRIRLKSRQSVGLKSNSGVTYDHMDIEDEISEMVTRNVFTWLRGDSGFPVAERAIREHEWIDNLESDDDCPIEGDVRSTVGGNVGKWLLEVSVRGPDSV